MQRMNSTYIKHVFRRPSTRPTVAVRLFVLLLIRLPSHIIFPLFLYFQQDIIVPDHFFLKHHSESGLARLCEMRFEGRKISCSVNPRVEESSAGLRRQNRGRSLWWMFYLYRPLYKLYLLQTEIGKSLSNIQCTHDHIRRSVWIFF